MQGSRSGPLTPEGRRRLVERIDEGRANVRVYISEEARREHLVPFLNEYNHDRPHTSLGNRPPISRAPVPGPKLTDQPIVLPERTKGQMVLDLAADNNVPRSA